MTERKTGKSQEITRRKGGNRWEGGLGVGVDRYIESERLESQGDFEFTDFREKNGCGK